MTPALPDILHDPKYKNYWDFKDGHPYAKPGAPEEIKTAIDKFNSEFPTSEDEVTDLGDGFFC